MNDLILLSIELDFSSPYLKIIVASMIVVLSYFFGIISERTSFPSVLLLILLGILLKLGLDYLDPSLFENLDLMPALELFGIVGLIMIVLEAALDLELTKEKLPFIAKSLLIALCALVGSVFLVGSIINYFLPLSFLLSLLYATPLCIISSAIVIPSVSKLSPLKKEFMVYESTFSDVLGIMIFYFLISFMESGGTQAAFEFGTSLILTILVGVVASYVLIYFFKDLKGHSKLFLLISILLLLYAIGKLLHLSPLLIILIFGMGLANHHIFFKVFKNELTAGDPIEKIEKDFHLLTLETAFLVRTFFFVIFGMTISLSSLVNLNVFIISAVILGALYIIRFITLRIFLGKSIVPELWISPRGLITILLFFAIPPAYKVSEFDPGILLYVIIISSLVMTFSLINDSRKHTTEIETAPSNASTDDDDPIDTIEKPNPPVI
ncbi:MAG: cation:proton antiporter [Saprospiraceae bacterium]